MRFRRTRPYVTVRIIERGVMPNFATGDPETAIGVARAILEGGCDVLEFLNRGPGAAAAFEALAAWARAEAPSLLLGAGTITEPASAAQFINAGAAFIVGPNFNAEVAAICGRLGVPYVPGCGTATEVSNALAAGADIVKLFPAPFLGGPPAVRALLGPFPHALFMPSGGVETDEASLRGWFAAGVAAVSIGGALISADVLARRDWAALTAETARVVKTIDAVRGTPR
jgi:2-dehydro-3-deoxyphosphogluconate aldolase/(4S)-4-hydroxy-2-oxoglutarate aldolase